MQKRSKLQGILEAKCPRCRQGDMFAYPVSNVLKFDKSNKTCSHCGFRFELEPGFFIGAMYISYAMSVGVLLVSAFVLYYVFGDPPLWVYIITVPVVTLLFLPLMFRYSRVLYLYMLTGHEYDEKLSIRNKLQ